VPQRKESEKEVERRNEKRENRIISAEQCKERDVRLKGGISFLK